MLVDHLHLQLMGLHLLVLVLGQLLYIHFLLEELQICVLVHSLILELEDQFVVNYVTIF